MNIPHTIFFSCTFYQIFIILQINVEKSMSELKGCDNLIKKLRRVAINVNKLVRFMII